MEVALVMRLGPARCSSSGVESNDAERIEQFLVARYGETSPKAAEDAAWIAPSGRLVGNAVDHETSATSALRVIGLRFPARPPIGSCGRAVDEMIRRGFMRWTFVDDLMGIAGRDSRTS